MKFMIINGVNLGMTGKREPEVYGTKTLDDINAEIKAHCEKNGDSAQFYQSDIEGEIVRAIHNANCDAIILNPGAYTHYSYAIRDAISCVKTPVIEVHMSNVHARESFRHTSVLSGVCKGVVIGFKEKGYILAIESFRI